VNLISSKSFLLHMRIVLLVIFLCNGFSLVAKNVDLDKEYKKLYHLFSQGKFSLLESQLNELEEFMGIDWNDVNGDINLLRLQHLKAEVLSWNEQISESLKLSLSILDPLLDAKEYAIAYRIYLNIALCHEKIEEFDVTKKDLNAAYQLYKSQGLDSIYSHYCIRKSSYYYRTSNFSSALSYAQEAESYAVRYSNHLQLQDAYILLGIINAKLKNYDASQDYSYRVVTAYKNNNDLPSIAVAYNNISINYRDIGNIEKALQFSDSAYHWGNYIKPELRYFLPKGRATIFEKAGQIDSAYFYHKKYLESYSVYRDSLQNFEINDIREKYNTSKNKAIIKSQNQRITFIVCLLILIAIASILLVNRNQKIRSQNKIINRQLEDLVKTLDQKQVLLSELQHRVKNNLQHVISILEIQKESITFNNIEELIRSNQNRIHSMVLLHNKLNVFENVLEVDFPKYVNDIAELVKESYDNSTQKISLKIKCEVPILSIDKALPIGLIIVELVSNSMKYAFTSDKLGIISISITNDIVNNHKKLYYVDNGPGFNFNETNYKGLGLEIIKGLIDQINGRLEAHNEDGFFFVINFD
jgi:two-component sensor histidine kinase